MSEHDDEKYEAWLRTLTPEETITVELFDISLGFYQMRKLISRIRALEIEAREGERKRLADMFYYDIHHSCLDSTQVGDLISGKPNIL